MFPEWLNYVNEKTQLSLVSILHELSHLQDKRDLNFIIIGAFPLLIRGYLKYKVCWDVDLLFKNGERLKQFMESLKTSVARIVNYDDDLMISENITSFHAAWTFDHTWFNVDYILRKNYFEYYTRNKTDIIPYEQSVTLNDRTYCIHLFVAHPWDIIVEKIVSPRTKKELNLKIDMSVDIRHIFSVYGKEKDNLQFWDYCLEKSRYLQAEKEFRENFMNLLKFAKDLGYDNVVMSPLSIKMLKQ
ncbi:hypothetical protein AMJ52_06560 [candidate division TA06 bacterium DG_78]|uniref:Nucleotidyltransferase family protein n=1 Tax=candidate division TA06 bacterium DG_78 TaxID=1703772 RepID=A0A0S7YDA6_UNCT6|nr:MAG: hypothetical protein AMJ52_06560 [candidate division TA06 bacterium DG_78]